MEANRCRVSLPVRRALAPSVWALFWVVVEVFARLERRRPPTRRAEEALHFRSWATGALRRGEILAGAIYARFAIAADPAAPEGYYLLHRAYLRKDWRAQARAALEQGLRASPEDLQLRLAQAAFEELGQRGRASPES